MTGFTFKNMSANAVTRNRANLLRLLKQPTTASRHLCTLGAPLEPTSATETDKTSDAESEAQLLNLLLQSKDGENWNQQQLLTLTSSITPPRFTQILRRLNATSTALKFFQWVQTNAPSILPVSKPNIYQTLIELASREQDPHLNLHKILQSSIADNVPLTFDSASTLIRHFARAKMATESLQVFNSLDPLHKTTNLCNSVLGGLYKCGRPDHARELLDEMLQPESATPPNDVTASIVFSREDVNVESMVELVSKFGEHGVFPSAEMLTRLITKLGRSGHVGKAWDLLHVVMEMDGPVEASSINSLLVGLSRHNNLEKMSLLLSEIDEKGSSIKPNHVTFGIFIHHLCKMRQVDQAMQVLDKMEKVKENGGDSVTPDIVIYNTIVKALCIVGRQEEGLDVVDRMRARHGYAPDVVTYNALIDGFCKAGEIERSRELFDQMKEEGVAPDVITLNILVDGMCKHGRISSALEFFTDMQKKGLKGNAITYTSLISAFCNVNNLEKAVDLFDQMVSSQCSPDSVVYYTLINGFTRAGKLDDACSIASKMKSAGFTLDAMSYNVLINGFCKKKNMDKVYELVREMEMMGVRPDKFTYNTLIATLSKSGDFSTVRELMTKMTNQGLAPTVVTYGAVINGYCKAGKLSKALEIFSLMGSTSKVAPNTVIYNILIDSLCKEGKIEEALSLMYGMKEKGVLPNVITYNAMFKGLRDMNCLDKAFELMAKMNEQAIDPDYVTMEILTEWLSAVGEIDKLRSFVRGYEVSVARA